MCCQGWDPSELLPYKNSLSNHRWMLECFSSTFTRSFGPRYQDGIIDLQTSTWYFLTAEATSKRWELRSVWRIQRITVEIYQQYLSPNSFGMLWILLFHYYWWLQPSTNLCFAMRSYRKTVTQCDWRREISYYVTTDASQPSHFRNSIPQ